MFMKKFFESGNFSASHRRRFILYIVSLLSMILALLLLLLNLFGIMNPARTEIDHVLDGQLQTFGEQVEQDYDDIAAFAISFAEQLEDKIGRYLMKENMTFQELDGSPEDLTTLQDTLYDTVYLYMQLAPSSGAFYFLDASVSQSEENRLYNGLYLKYINLSSENTVNNEISLYRGSYATGKHHEISFHSGWQNEMRTDFFANRTDSFTEGIHYKLSTTIDLPETWERARYVYVPIRDSQDQIIGVCGFEINDLFFQLIYDTNDANAANMTRALLDKISGHYSGQFNRAGYPSGTENAVPLGLMKQREDTYFTFDSEIYVGKTREIKLGGDEFTLATMMPESQYSSIVRKGQVRTGMIFFIIAIFAAVCCLLMSKKYVSPIDNYEERLSSLENAKKLAEAEAQKRKASYEKALREYEFAQAQLDMLSDMHRSEIELDDYMHFVQNLDTLTPTERKIYDLYQEGRKSKDVCEAMNITENTLKFHNKNIYSKLGVSSRKQLLKLSVLKQHEDDVMKKI